jgi:hypothetical protein
MSSKIRITIRIVESIAPSSEQDLATYQCSDLAIVPSVRYHHVLYWGRDLLCNDVCGVAASHYEKSSQLQKNAASARRIDDRADAGTRARRCAREPKRMENTNSVPPNLSPSAAAA